jgi:hypothetical protein
MARRRDPYSWTVVRLPERDLAESILDFASPLLESLGPNPAIDAVRERLDLAITFWNASVLASARWERPRQKELKELRRRLRDDAATFDLLAERWRDFWLDPRLVAKWTYDRDEDGAHLVCEVGLPDGVRAEVPPPIEKRVAIGGKFLDEVRIRLNASSYVSFPVSEHSGSIGADGTATVRARMPTALQLFAEGLLPRVGGDPVELVIGGRSTGAMVLSDVVSGGEYGRHDIAVLVFRPAHAEVAR